MRFLQLLLKPLIRPPQFLDAPEGILRVTLLLAIVAMFAWVWYLHEERLPFYGEREEFLDSLVTESRMYQLELARFDAKMKRLKALPEDDVRSAAMILLSNRIAKVKREAETLREDSESMDSDWQHDLEHWKWRYWHHGESYAPSWAIVLSIGSAVGIVIGFYAGVFLSVRWGLLALYRVYAWIRDGFREGA